MATVNKKSTRKKVSKKTNSEAIVSELAKDFSVQIMSKDAHDLTPYYIPFVHKGLQYITGGVPGGRFTEISGDSQSGKSFLFYELIKSCLEMGGEALLIDPELAYEPKYGQRVGIDGQFLYTHENKMEKCFALSRKYIKSVRKKNKKGPILIGLDSYPAIQTQNALKEIEKLENPNTKELKGYLAAKKNALLSELISDFVPFIGKYDATFVLINQIRVKMNVMFGDPTMVNAENIIKFYATLRLQGKLSSAITKEIDIGKTYKKKKKIGVDSIWKTIKNRNIDPFKETTAKILYRKGIDPLSGFADLMVMEEKFTLAHWSKENQNGKKQKVKGYKYNKTRFTENKLPQVLERYPEIMDMT